MPERDLLWPLLFERGYRLFADPWERTTSILWFVTDPYGRRCVVKASHPNLPRGHVFSRIIEDEAVFLDSLYGTPGIPRLLDQGLPPERPYIVTEYIEGPSLKQLLNDRDYQADISRVVELFARLCSPLQATHDALIVHRDITPSNIVIAAGNRPYLIDFGIAAPFDYRFVGFHNLVVAGDLETTSGIIGTAAYMPPETARGQPSTTASDLYAFGACLFHALTGRYLFEGDSPVRVAYKHVGEEPIAPSKLRPDIPRELDELVWRCLAKRPADRPGSPTEVGQALWSIHRQLTLRTSVPVLNA